MLNNHLSQRWYTVASPFSFLTHRLLEINNKYSAEAAKNNQENGKNTDSDTHNKEVCMCADV